MLRVVAEWDCSYITIDSSNGVPIILFEDPDKSKTTHGVVKNWQTWGMSLEQAKQLSRDLRSAIKKYEELDRLAQHYID